MKLRFTFFVPLVLALLAAPAAMSQSLSQKGAQEALDRVVSFYRSEVGYKGAYLWRYSADLKYQEGEGIATKTSGWTQPPGSSSVGEAFLNCWRMTGDTKCLEAAVEAAHALVESQLQSGGWSSHFDLGKEGRRKYAYRVDGKNSGSDNRTTFDDNKSQSALMLLMHVDEALEQNDARVHEAVEYALQKMLLAQFPNGAWPQQYSEPADARDFPVLKASYPDSWPRTFPKQRYISYYTLNDGNMSHIVEMLFEAHRIYSRDNCFQAAERTGEFFLLAQMPEPQPGWAQQYNTDMHPAWARKFEPASVTGGESQGVMRTLLTIYQHTGNRTFIETIPRALAYYQKSLLPEGQLARFYELKTNRPLYFTKEYELTYSDADMPTHYAFKVSAKLDSIERQYNELAASDPASLKPAFRHRTPAKVSQKLTEQASAVVKALDDRGAWVEKGSMEHQKQTLDVIDMRTFAKNVETLAAYAGAK